MSVAAWVRFRNRIETGPTAAGDGLGVARRTQSAVDGFDRAEAVRAARVPRWTNSEQRMSNDRQGGPVIHAHRADGPRLVG
jgi:hypothetical protein